MLPPAASPSFAGWLAAGLIGLYRGAHVNMLKIAVASAVQLAVFDGVKARLLRPPSPQQAQQVRCSRAGWWEQPRQVLACMCHHRLRSHHRLCSV